MIANGGFTPGRVQRPREQVEHQIRQAILAGAFREGDKLPSETELAANFSVSRTTVREALRSLVQAGFITKVPGVTGGSFVRTIDHRSLGTMLQSSMDNILRMGSITPAEVVAVRRMLEVPCAELAALHRTGAHVTRLHELIAQEKVTDIADPGVSELDATFHSTLADASGNRLLAAFISALHRVARPVELIELRPEVGSTTVRQHIALAKAVERRDAVAAVEAMVAHLDYLGAQAPRAGGLEGAS